MKKNKKRLINVMLVIVTLAAIVMFALSLIVNTKTIQISSTDKNTIIGLLYCRADTVDDSFFPIQKMNDILHEIKITFKDGIADRINYALSGKYVDKKTAMQAKADANFRLGSYMSKSGLDSSMLNPKISIVDTTLYYNIDGTEDTLNQVSAPVFLLSESMGVNFNKYSQEDFANFYTSKGFSCEIKY